MNGKKAKKIRKQVYGDKDFRERNYGRLKSGEVMTIEKGMKVSSRRIYKKLKKQLS